ncbi:MAG TPA: GntR family transcriptional regulator [Magnetospirillum sp.]|jgi:DNA-binding GntR family transcriptional regulator|nr:GntR family transcriptional regulator [Magnetospirillum sp.]
MSDLDSPARPLRRTTLAEDAYGALRDILLVDGRFAPGEKISVEELSRELGVSRSPIWTAVARLEAEGVLRVVPRQGVFMVDFDAGKVANLFQAREALEGMAARLAAANVEQANMAELNLYLARQREALQHRDDRGYAHATQLFHDRIIALSGNPTIEKMVAALYSQMQAMCGPVVATSWPERSIYWNDHSALVAALSHRDADEAESQARRHVRRVAEAALRR